jgi:hypothetical protein
MPATLAHPDKIVKISSLKKMICEKDTRGFDHPSFLVMPAPAGIQCGVAARALIERAGPLPARG